VERGNGPLKRCICCTDPLVMAKMRRPAMFDKDFQHTARLADILEG
jgi:hypothetical protein